MFLLLLKNIYISINIFFLYSFKAEPSPYFWLAMKYTTNYIYNTMMSLWFIFHNKQVVKKFVPYPNHEMVRVQSSKTLKKESPPNSSCLFRNSHMYYVYRGWVKMAVSKLMEVFSMKIFLFFKKPKFHYKLQIRKFTNSIKSVVRIRILRFQNINPNRCFINGVTWYTPSYTKITHSNPFLFSQGCLYFTCSFFHSLIIPKLLRSLICHKWVTI